MSGFFSLKIFGCEAGSVARLKFDQLRLGDFETGNAIHGRGGSIG